jgi:hypothetical protein
MRQKHTKPAAVNLSIDNTDRVTEGRERPSHLLLAIPKAAAR